MFWSMADIPHPHHHFDHWHMYHALSNICHTHSFEQVHPPPTPIGHISCKYNYLIAGTLFMFSPMAALPHPTLNIGTCTMFCPMAAIPHPLHFPLDSVSPCPLYFACGTFPHLHVTIVVSIFNLISSTHIFFCPMAVIHHPSLNIGARTML